MPTDRSDLVRELEPLLRDPRHTPSGNILSFCPAHTDGQKHGNRSLSLHPVYGLTCFAGCKFEDILAAFNVLKAKGSTNGHHDASKGHIVAVYEYRDHEGKLIAEKCRIEYPDGRKTFRWRLPGGTWDAGLGDLRMKDMPLYGAQEIARAKPEEPLWFVEGEKAQRAMALQGFLAVTHGGGASTRDFGTSLDVLRGRTVVLWPDNDVPGREYMGVVDARLRTLGVQTRYVACPVPLPPKGDAYDYFAAGGSAQALRDIIAKDNAAPQSPTVMVTEDGGLLVTLPYGGQPVKFALEAIETGSRRFDAEMTITMPGAEPYSERVNLLSSSQRTELRRELDSLYGKEYEWARMLNKAFGLARGFYGELDRGVDVVDIQDVGEQAFDIADLLPSDHPTIMFGDGGASKSTFACALAYHYCMGLPFLGRATPGKPVLYVDWEDTDSEFKRCIRRMAGSTAAFMEAVGRGRLFYWSAVGVSLRDQRDAIRAKVRKMGAGLVVYDTVAPGCSGPPEDSSSATGFLNDVRWIGRTAMCLAHITKKGEEEKPFGSAFWHNGARRTWLLKAASSEPTAEKDIALICKKVNHGVMPRSIPVRLSFTDPNGPIRASVGAFNPSSDLAKAATSLNGRIHAALARGAMSYGEIAKALEEDVDKIRVYMNRHRDEYVPVAGGKWGNAVTE